ncbi:hypothetical protein EV368DRAFT_65610 [Lentinula lateritia]|nr:hypothetical protein EV368DRAFT_65610 [Lentinula lateritia]
MLKNTKFNLVGWWRKWPDRWLPKHWGLVSQIRIEIIVIDNHQKINGSFKLSEVLSREFEPGAQWASICAAEAGVPCFEDMDYPKMGRILAIEAQKTLAQYVLLTDNPEDTSINFHSVSEDLNNLGQYTIEDEGRYFKTKISSTLLMNLAFNLLDWYKKHLKMAEKELQRQISSPVKYKFLPRLYGEPTSPFEHGLDQ